MDLLHEELKEPIVEVEDVQTTSAEESMEVDKSQSDVGFQPCESCGTCDKIENDAVFKPVLEDPAETTMLIQDDENNLITSKDWQKEKISSNKLNRENSMEDLEKDTNSTSEANEFLNNQGTVKVQIHSRLSGNALLMCNSQILSWNTCTSGRELESMVEKHRSSKLAGFVCKQCTFLIYFFQYTYPEFNLNSPGKLKICTG